MPFRLPKTILGVAAVAVLAISLAGCGSDAQSTNFAAQLTGAKEVPPVVTDATGSATITYNADTRRLTWTVAYAGLSGPATGAHFHGPAALDAGAGVAVSLGDNVGTPITGNATITTEQATQLLAGRWYLNVHTAANPNGEIRGQVVVTAAP